MTARRTAAGARWQTISARVRHNGDNVGVVVATITTSRKMGLPEIEESRDLLPRYLRAEIRS